MPLVPFLPIVSALVNIGLMASLPWTTWERLIIWMAIGVVFYFAYGYRKSKLRRAVTIRDRDATSTRLADDELALHLLAAIVLREVAVERETAGLVRAELEDDGLTGGGALGDAVRDVDGEAVGDVLCRELDADEVVFLDLDPGGGERELVAD